VYQKLIDGFHVVRTSERKWAGLSTDLVLEQVLIRSMKMSGGLTRGRGMTEQQRLIWLLSSPVCAEMNHPCRISQESLAVPASKIWTFQSPEKTVT